MKKFIHALGYVRNNNYTLSWDSNNDRWMVFPKTRNITSFGYLRII